MKILTPETKLNILQDYNNPELKLSDIAEKYHISRSYVSLIALEMGAMPRSTNTAILLSHKNNLPVKTDCFAYMSKCKQCSVLTELVCRKRKCTFYKTREQFDADRLKYDSLVAAKLRLKI